MRLSIRGAKKRQNAWRGAPADYSLYAPVPHLAEDFWSLADATEEKILRILISGGKRQANDTWVCGQHSYAGLARQTRLHWTTIKRRVETTRFKEMVDTRPVWARDQKGGRRVGTLYSIPSYQDALERRRKIPGVAKTPAGHVLCIGRKKRLMTQAEAVDAWGINLAMMPPTSARQEPARQRHSSVTHTHVTRNDPDSGMPAAPPANALDEDAILQALLAHCPANIQDARDLLAAARGAAPAIPLVAVLAELEEIARRKAALDAKRRDPRPIVTPRWFLDRMPSHVEHWRAAERVRAKDAEREARNARDARLNGLAWTIGRLEKLGDGDGEAMPDGSGDGVTYITERAFDERQIAAADPAEVAEARRLRAGSRTMGA